MSKQWFKRQGKYCLSYRKQRNILYKCKFNLFKRFRNSWIKRRRYAYFL